MGTIRVNGSTSGYVELAAPAVAGSVVMTLPATTGTLAVETGAWTTYTPTLSGITFGNGTIVARYTQIGKVVFATVRITLGSTSAVTGAMAITLPVTGRAGSSASGAQCYFVSDGATYPTPGICDLSSQTYCYLRVLTTAAAYVGVNETSATVPWTWKTSDIIQFDAVYEAA